jgi:hypothetical protein
MLVPVGGLLGCAAGVGDSVEHIKSPGEGFGIDEGSPTSTLSRPQVPEILPLAALRCIGWSSSPLAKTAVLGDTRRIYH